MPNPPVLDALAAQIKTNTDVEDSATLLINGIAARIQAAVDKAIAGGATADQLAPITDEITSLKTASDNLAAAVVANTPAA
jgi:hypothetical protein